LKTLLTTPFCRATLSGELLQVNARWPRCWDTTRSSGAELLLRDLPLIFSAAAGFEDFRKSLLEKSLIEGSAHPGRDGVWVRRDALRFRSA